MFVSIACNVKVKDCIYILNNIVSCYFTETSIIRYLAAYITKVKMDCNLKI